MLPTDPRTLDLLDRLTALRADAAVSIRDARLAIEATDAVLRSSRAALARRPLPPVTVA